MDVTIQPIFLFADSQLLFWRDGDALFLKRTRQLLPTNPAAAYLGASNGDLPEFYQLFCGAMDAIGIDNCRMIPRQPSRDDLEFFDHADLILLAGGSIEGGWQAFESNGLRQKVIDRHQAGALLIGISAGAVQLGLQGYKDSLPEDSEDDLFDTFQLIPLLIDVHQEPEWRRLTHSMPRAADYIQGLGIASGGGAIVHPDMTIEPVRQPLDEFSVRDGEVRRSLLMPPAGSPEEAQARDDESPDEAAG